MAEGGQVDRTDEGNYPRRRRIRHSGSRVASHLDWQPFTIDTTHLAWQADALCVGMDPDSFFPEGPVHPFVVNLCRSCPVNATCLQYALGNPHLAGIWAGTTHEDRRVLLAGARPRRTRAS